MPLLNSPNLSRISVKVAVALHLGEQRELFYFHEPEAPERTETHRQRKQLIIRLRNGQSERSERADGLGLQRRGRGETTECLVSRPDRAAVNSMY